MKFLVFIMIAVAAEAQKSLGSPAVAVKTSDRLDELRAQIIPKTSCHEKLFYELQSSPELSCSSECVKMDLSMYDPNHFPVLPCSHAYPGRTGFLQTACFEHSRNEK